MDIVISKDEIIEYKKLTVISEITLTKEKTTLFEKKYGCSIDEFRKRMEESNENFEEWDDYIEWKANFEVLKDLENKLIELDNAKNIRIV
ncbi:MAG: hypothetical protein ACTSQD_07335 [Promethearchaeota archaeon]